jgi:hypothetical protein
VWEASESISLTHFDVDIAGIIVRDIAAECIYRALEGLFWHCLSNYFVAYMKTITAH